MNKKQTMNRLEMLIDDSVHLEEETYDRDVFEAIWKLFKIQSLICPKCGDNLMKQVASSNLNCVNCGETFRENSIQITNPDKK